MRQVEVVEPRSSALARAVMLATPMPTPMSAVSSGSPAATSEPKVMTQDDRGDGDADDLGGAGLRHRLERVTADLDGQARRPGPPRRRPRERPGLVVSSSGTLVVDRM